MVKIKAFLNGQVCLNGRFAEETVYIDKETGLIVRKPDEMPEDFIDLDGAMLCPAFIELQTNGALGFHFTSDQEKATYDSNLHKVSCHYVGHGIGSFYVTLPSIPLHVLEKVLKKVTPRTFEDGAEILGVHCEGPWLAKDKRGAHDEKLMVQINTPSGRSVHDSITASSSVKMVTLAPELEGAQTTVQGLASRQIIVSLGHSTATYDVGAAALGAGATMLTHVFNAMPPLHHRKPGLAGLIASEHAPFYSVIADGIHLHPAVVTMAFRSNPERCILISDSVELAGMPDGVYPGHAQIPHRQHKQGNRVTIAGTDTLVGSTCGVDECVRNLVRFSGCSWPEAVRCASENIVDLMGIRDRGRIEAGRRADFVVLNAEGAVMQTWIGGRLIFDNEKAT